jgi:hypothetical protein
MQSSATTLHNETETLFMIAVDGCSSVYCIIVDALRRRRCATSISISKRFYAALPIPESKANEKAN